jgi:hypothetical protein
MQLERAAELARSGSPACASWRAAFPPAMEEDGADVLSRLPVRAAAASVVLAEAQRARLVESGGFFAGFARRVPAAQRQPIAVTGRIPVYSL